MPTRTRPAPKVSSTTTTLYALACGSQVAADLWLVVTVALGWPIRIGCAAVLAMVLTACMAMFMRSEVDRDKFPEVFGPPPVDDDADWKVAERDG